MTPTPLHRGALVALAVAMLACAPGCNRIRPYLPENPFVSPEVPSDIQKIAVLPFAFRDEVGIHPCTLCPNAVIMAPTSADDATLVTGFFYEALTRHPRFEVVPFDIVDRFIGDTMQQTVDRLQVMEDIDAVLVGALLELRPRIGDPQDPAEAGGAAVYAALLDARSGKQLWNLVFDRTQPPANAAEKGYEVVVGGGNLHWLSAQGIAQEAALEMMSNMARSVR
jgi:hypothetical protein